MAKLCFVVPGSLPRFGNANVRRVLKLPSMKIKKNEDQKMIEGYGV